MNSLVLLLLESSSLVFCTGLLILLYGLRHAPEGFQHYNLFYYGEPPTGLIPVESPGSAPAAPSGWR
jgi:hypothetical protein